LDGKWCHHHEYGLIENLISAEQYCSHDVRCKGIEDDYCDGDGFWLCEIGFDYEYDAYSCMHDKREVKCRDDTECEDDKLPYCVDYNCVECRGDTNCNSTKPICDIQTWACMEDVQFGDKIGDKGCSFHYIHETFSNITSAEERCRRDSSCKGVYDQGCDESRDNVYLCIAGHEYEDSIHGDCIYDKKEITSALDQGSHGYRENQLN